MKWKKQFLVETKEIQLQLSENDWLCEKCKTINKFDKTDRRSCYCKQCKEKNNAIAMMIAQQNNEKHVINTHEQLKDYSKQKTNIIESTVVQPQI